jgi:hypothetical protein
MDIVYKKGPVNHADALSRRPNMKGSLHKLQLLRDICVGEGVENSQPTLERMDKENPSMSFVY